jgi:hypothetical protein
MALEKESAHPISPLFPQIFISIQFIFPLPSIQNGLLLCPQTPLNPSSSTIPPPFRRRKNAPKVRNRPNQGGNNPLLAGKEHNKSPNFPFIFILLLNLAKPARKQG